MEEKSKRSTQKKAEKQKILLEAAYRVFSRKGYHNAKVEEIAAEAGVGKGTVYEYFPSKQAIFQQMLEERNNNMIQQIVFSMKSGEKSLRERTQEVLRFHMDFFIQNRDISFLLMQELPFMEKKMKEWFVERQKQREEMTRIAIQEMIDRRMITDVDIDAFLVQLFGTLLSLQFSVVLGKYQQEDTEKLAVGLTNLLLQGIEPAQE